MVHPVSVLFWPYSLGMVHNIGPQRILPLVPIRSPKTPQKNRAYFGGERSQQILGLHFAIAFWDCTLSEFQCTNNCNHSDREKEKEILSQ